MAIPHIFATQTGNVPASQWDDNFSYVLTEKANNDLSETDVTPSGVPTTFPMAADVRFGYEATFPQAHMDATEMDITLGFQRALASGKRVIVPSISSGYTLSAPLSASSGSSLAFERPGQIVVCMTDFMRIGASGAITDVSLDGNGCVLDFRLAPSGSAAFRMATSVNRQWRLDVRRFNAVNASGLIVQDSNNSNFTFRASFEDMTSYAPRGGAVSIFNAQGFLELSKVTEDRTWNDNIGLSGVIPTYQVTWPAFSLGGTTESGGIQIRRDCGAFGTGATVAVGAGGIGSTSSAHGIVASNQISMSIEDFLSDTITGQGGVFSNLLNCFIEMEAFSCLSGGISCTQTAGNDIYGGNEFRLISIGSGSTSGATGIVMQNGRRNEATLLKAKGWSGAGVTIDGEFKLNAGVVSSHSNGAAALLMKGANFGCQIGSFSADGNAGFGVDEPALGGSFNVGSVYTTGNAMGNYRLSSAASGIQGGRITSGGSLAAVSGNGTAGGVTG
jgi:hypothetical protein